MQAERTGVQNPLPDSAKDLRDELHDLHHRAGRPSLRAIGRQVGCSHSTVSKIFGNPSSSAWETTGHIVSTLGGDTSYFRKLWYQATGGAREPEAAGGPGMTRIARAEVMSAGCPQVEDWLLTELETHIGLAPDPEAMQRLHLADDLTLLACKLQLQEDLCKHYGMAVTLPGRHHLRVGNHILRISVEPHPVNERTMWVAIHDPWIPAATYLTEELTIGPQSGRYTGLSLTAPRSLPGWLVETCASRTTVLITSAYRWLERTIAQSANRLASPFEEETLRLFRKFLPARLLTSPVAESLFLALVMRGRVSYAIDDTAIRGALLAAQSDPHQEHAPAIAVSDMFFNSIPFSHSFSRHAVNRDRPVLVDLSRAPYQGIAQDYLVAQTVIHRGRSLLVPVARTPNIVVLANYPAGLSSSLATAISALRTELASSASDAGGILRAPISRRMNRSAYVSCTSRL